MFSKNRLFYRQKNLSLCLLSVLLTSNLAIWAMPINAQQKACAINDSGQHGCVQPSPSTQERTNNPTKLSDTYVIRYPRGNTEFQLKVTKCFESKLYRELTCTISITKTQGQDFEGELSFIKQPSGVRFYGDGTMSASSGYPAYAQINDGRYITSYMNLGMVPRSRRLYGSGRQIIENNRPFSTNFMFSIYRSDYSYRGPARVKKVEKLKIPFDWSYGEPQYAIFGNIDVSQ
jgi:hypothetical protein